MRNDSLRAQVRGRLLRKGMTRAHAERAAAELAEHFEDLVAESERQGQTRAAAEAYALARIGEPDAIADDLFGRLSETSWLARHAAACFALLPLALIVLWWAALFGGAGWAMGAFSDPSAGGGIAPRIASLLSFAAVIKLSSGIAVPMLCSHIAQHFYCGWKPALWSALIVAAHNAMHLFQISGAAGTGTLTWGYSFSWSAIPDIAAVSLPLAAFAAFWFWNTRSERLQIEPVEALT
jgi:hypothetical protein